MLTEQDDNRHKPTSDDPLFSESWVFHAYDPKNDLWVATRFGLEANRQKASLAVLLAVEGKEVYNHVRKEIPIPDGDMISGMTMDGYSVVAKKLLKEFQFKYEDAPFQFKFDLNWDAIMPAHDAIPEDQGENAAASFHLEQAGRVTGELSFLNRSWDFQGVGNRDHALGFRDWSKILRHALAWPVFEDGTAMSITRGYDLISKTPFDLMWYFDGKEVRPLKFISNKVKLNEEDYPLSAEFVAEDENGNRFELSCSRRAVIHWAIDGYLLLENCFEFRLQDGRVGYGLMELGKKLGVFTSEELSSIS